jgi:DnaD/phage-associated family protein
MSKLLLDEQPLVILPQLAVKVGLNEAIVLQQFHYWLEKSTNVHDGFKWIYNTYAQWQEQFPWWSESTLRRTITKLEKSGVIIAGNYNKMKIDNTKWYRIDYPVFNALVSSSAQNEQTEEHMNRPPAQNEQTDRSKWTDEEVNLNTPLPEITSEITSENLGSSSSKGKPVDVAAIIQFWDANGFGHNNTNAKTDFLAYLEDGFTAEVLLKALVVAGEENKRTLKYVKGILRNWENAGAKTLDAVDAHLAEFENNKVKPPSKKGDNKKDGGNDGAKSQYENLW